MRLYLKTLQVNKEVSAYTSITKNDFKSHEKQLKKMFFISEKCGLPVSVFFSCGFGGVWSPWGDPRRNLQSQGFVHIKVDIHSCKYYHQGAA